MDDCDKRMRCDSYLKATFLSVLCESEIKHINRGVPQRLGGFSISSFYAIPTFLQRGGFGGLITF